MNARTCSLHIHQARVQGPVIAPFCKRELGCPGECEDIDTCLCMCYTIRAGQVNVTTAYFGELGTRWNNPSGAIAIAIRKLTG